MTLPVQFVWCKPEVLGRLKEHLWRRLHLFGSSGVNQKFFAGYSSSRSCPRARDQCATDSTRALSAQTSAQGNGRSRFFLDRFGSCMSQRVHFPPKAAPVRFIWCKPEVLRRLQQRACHAHAHARSAPWSTRARDSFAQCVRSSVRASCLWLSSFCVVCR